MIQVRPGKVEDAPEIANVHLNTWREAYAGLVPQDYLDNLPLSFRARQKNWIKSLSLPERYVTVVEDDVGLVGFSLFGKARDPQMETYAELGAVYLFKKYHGQGFGYKLLQAGFQEMKKRGYHKAYCWVLENNPTIRFYERSGAVFANLRKVDNIGGRELTELMYAWDQI